MKLSLRTKLMAVLVLAPVLLLLAAIGAIWTLDYRQRVAEQGGMFRGEAVQVARSLRLAVERSIGSLNELLSLGDVAGLLQTRGGWARAICSRRLGSFARDKSIRSGLPCGSTARKFRLCSTTLSLRDYALLGERTGSLRSSLWRIARGSWLRRRQDPADYDQSDETWWREGMRLGPGQAFLEGFHYDESAGVLALDIALPIVPEALGSAIGVLKAVVNVSTLLASVTVLSTATEARAEVVGKDGAVLSQLSDKSFVPSGEQDLSGSRAPAAT